MAQNQPAELTGQRFGMLTVEGPQSRPGRRVWACRCDCGQVIEVTTGNLRNRSYTNCGCNRSGVRRQGRLRHGHARPRTKEYRTWAHLVQRCINPSNAAYALYGGRGVTVDPEWAASFEAFLRDVGHADTPDHTIDRIDNSRGYEPGNCRWATRAEQSRNTRRNIMVDGVCLKDACQMRGVSYEAAQARLRRGATMVQALSTLTGSAYRAMLSAAPKEEPDHG